MRLEGLTRTTVMNLKDIFEKLYKAYGPQHWWPAETPFEMMTGAILTQNTAWSNVEKAILNFGGRLSPEFVLGIDTEELAQIIRPSGFFNQKAQRLKHLAEWFKIYDFDIDRIKSLDPESIRQELLSISGVGPETADSIMLYAFDFPYFVVDAYTRRIFSRLGFELPDGYEEIRSLFENSLERDADLFGEYHALIVRLAKEHCKKVPDCSGCPLSDICRYKLKADVRK